MAKPIILTGLRANNDLHIGNYLGALLPLVDMAKQKADDYQINLFVPDLHSFTTPVDHKQLQAQIMHNIRLFVAAGLPIDNPNIHIYRQSYIPAHSELTWILDCFTGFGEMSRMTQFKDKSRSYEVYALLNLFENRINEVVHDFEKLNDLDDKPRKQEELSIKQRLEKLRTDLAEAQNAEDIKGRASVGLFNYPVLMAADILLYGAQYVPVGDDQSQHLEFTRDIAMRLNSQFGELFTMPKAVQQQHEFFGKDQGLRIRDLVDPAKKMSKSDETGKGVIFMGDSPEIAHKKIMSATTDSLGKVNYDYAQQPGISNLLDILKLFGGNPAEFIGLEQYGPLKSAVAEKVTAFLTDFQSKLAAVNDDQIQAKLVESEAAMNIQANATLLSVQKAVGLR